MLNLPQLPIPFSMAPSGSLNSLPIASHLLHSQDPLAQQAGLTGADLMSRAALRSLLQTSGYDASGNLRQFISQFDPTRDSDSWLLQLISQRLCAIVITARGAQHWQQGDPFQRRLARHWQSISTLVLSGGITSLPFGPALASSVESSLQDLTLIASPWGGQTALIGMAETVAETSDLMVFDFGSTHVKRGIAHQLGNRIDLLPDLPVKPFLHDGKMRAEGVRAILTETRQRLNRRLPVAISMAVYLDRGHPFDYRTGKYQDLRLDCQNLHAELAQHWLPEADFGDLKLLVHDSSAAALAFSFGQPAMMITLGTGLGSAPCPFDVF